MVWDDVRVFLAIVEHGSLTAAANALGLDHSTVSRRLAALEHALGAPLVVRSRGGVRLTEDGAAAEALARRAEEPLRALGQLAAGGTPGTVRIATSGILAQLLATGLPAFARAHPEIRLELTVSRALVQLAKRQADIALRLRPPGAFVAEPSTLALKVGEVGFAVYGRRDQLRARAAPIVRFASQPARAYVEALGVPTLATVDDIPTAIAMLRAGGGVAVLPCFLGDAEPSFARASDVLERHRLYIAVLAEQRKAPRIDATIRWMKQLLRDRG